jgi:hypothetical protein
MYIAEIKGKLPSSLNNMEDILTSNVFSFLKYSNRNVFLKLFLNQLGLSLGNNELNSAEFIFWPTFEDGTEPDLLILVGKYYLLFEAKLYSDFGDSEDEQRKQLVREAKWGLNNAERLEKIFFLIAITNDYFFKEEKYKCLKNYKTYLKWINWQKVTELLLNLIEKNGVNLKNYDFAEDLYGLLEKKNLRAYRAFDKLADNRLSKLSNSIFFPKEKSRFVKDFNGFKKAFFGFKEINACPNRIFYNRMFFNEFNKIKDFDIDFSNNIFYGIKKVYRNEVK